MAPRVERVQEAEDDLLSAASFYEADHEHVRILAIAHLRRHPGWGEPVARPVKSGNRRAHALGC